LFPFAMNLLSFASKKKKKVACTSRGIIIPV
jgi:hypothetical protein